MSLHFSSDQSISPKYPPLPLDNTSTRQIAQRWCYLAEQRLDYLTELFDSGRWRRFHNEKDFLDNVQEAKASVERWRAMAEGRFVMPVIAAAPRLQPVLPVPDAVVYEPPVLETVVAPAGSDREEQGIARVLPHLVVVNDVPVVAEAVQEPVAPSVPLDLFDRAAIVDRYPMLRAAM